MRVKDKVFFPKVSEEWIITLGITEENGGSLEALEVGGRTSADVK